MLRLVRSPPVLAALAVLGLLLHAAPCRADDAPEAARRWKLTVGRYFYDRNAGSDFNLRWRNDTSSAWAGVYDDPDFGTQWRAGVDTTLQASRLVQLQPSLQVASGGFVGGSLNLQLGDVWYAYAGLGRTNLRPYFNLTFDPNDAVTWGVGHRTAAGAVYTVFLVADDRLGTGQQDWHANLRLPVAGSRLTLDVLYKRGAGDAGQVSGWGFSAGWDLPTWFVRVARDPYQNFSVQDAWRIAGGLRF
jgi:hypothetical protein